MHKNMDNFITFFVVATALFSMLCGATLYEFRNPNRRRNMNDNFEVQAKCGTVRGKKVDLKNNELQYVVQYLGIPYAEPPIGDRRWKKTELKQKWKGVFDATRFGPVCPQSLDGPLPTVLLPVWFDANNSFIKNSTRNMAEDCLFLNIYVPASFHEHELAANSRHAAKRLPVMVYFHGHTFSEGSGNFYDGSVLASYGNVVVVTFNYRLGALGFLSMLDDNLHGNYGLWDQILLLDWVQKYIHEFGGDPATVTAFGSGAGAASVGLLMLSVYTGKEYFQRAILQSGSALAPWAIVRNPKQYAKALADDPRINCPTNSTDLMLRCLRGIPWKNLVKAKINPTPFDLAFGPVVDGRDQLLTHFPIDLLRKGEFTNYDVMIGVSQADGFGYVRDRLKACPSCSMSDNSVSFFASKALYKRVNFNFDFSSFVHSFYRSSDTTLIEEILKFLYTDWTDSGSSTSMKKSLMQLYTDRQWVEPAVTKADIQASHYHPAFFYSFSHHPGSDLDRSWVKCALGEDIPFVFGAPFFPKEYPLFPYNYTPSDAMVSLAVITYWTNFAVNGDPMNGKHQQTTYLSQKQNQFQNLIWPRYNIKTRPYLDISSQPGIYNHYRAEKVAFWRKFLPRFTGLPRVDYTVEPSLFQSSIEESDTWVLKPSSTREDGSSQRRNGQKGSDAADNTAMNMQLSMTLAVGFVLLFVNIIAFAIVSYHKEKDKYKIEKLQSEIKGYRKKLSMNANGVSKQNKDQKVLEQHLGQTQKAMEKQKISDGNSDTKLYSQPPTIPYIAKHSGSATPLGLNGKVFMESNRTSSTTNSIYPDFKPVNDSAHYSGDNSWSVSTLVSPRQINGQLMVDQNKPNTGAVISPNADCQRKKEKIYWSKGEFEENKEANVSRASLVSDIRTNTLPRFTSPLPMTSSSSNGYVQKQPLRCRSAMGIYPPQEGDYGSILKKERYQSSFRQRIPTDKNGRDNKGYTLDHSFTRPRYHGSVQYLPYYNSCEFSPNNNGAFVIPRPTTTIDEMLVPSRVGLPTNPNEEIGGRNTNEVKKKEALHSTGFNSVTTKL